jgi:hypothetical protein
MPLAATQRQILVGHAGLQPTSMVRDQQLQTLVIELIFFL